MFAVLPLARRGGRLTMVMPARKLGGAMTVALVVGALVAWAVPAAAQTTTDSTTTTTETTTVSTTVTAPPKTTTETSTTTVTGPGQTTTIKNNTTSVVTGTTTPTTSHSSNYLAWWVWVLIGLGAVGVAVAVYQLGRGSGEKAAASRYQAPPGQRPRGGPGDGWDDPTYRDPPPPSRQLQDAVGRERGTGHAGDRRHHHRPARLDPVADRHQELGALLTHDRAHDHDRDQRHDVDEVVEDQQEHLGGRRDRRPDHKPDRGEVGECREQFDAGDAGAHQQRRAMRARLLVRRHRV